MKKYFLKELAGLVKYLTYYTGFSPLPFRVSLELTDRCNFLCPTCSKWREGIDPAKEMSTEEWKGTINALQRKVIYKRFTFSGGEPLLREDLFELVEHAHQKGFHTLVVTNGFYLTRDVLNRFEKAGLHTLVISFNGISAHTHDRSRGVDGSYARIMNILPVLKKYRFKTNLQTIIMDTNVDDLLPLAELAREHGLNGISYQVLADTNVHYPFIRQQMKDVSRNWYRTNSLWVKNTEKVCAVIEELVNKQRDGYPILNTPRQLRTMIHYYRQPELISQQMICLSGSNMYIDPYGEVHLCYGLGPAGNIHAENPIKIWRSRKAREVRQKIKACPQMCRLLNNNF